jgi:hypothetical protein
MTSRERAAFALAARWLRHEPIAEDVYPMEQIGTACGIADSMTDRPWAEDEECAVVAESLSLDGVDHRRVK